MPDPGSVIEGLSEPDVERIASAVAAKLRADPPPLGEEDRERIVQALASRLGGRPSREREPDPDSAHEHERTWTEVLERGTAPDDPGARALEGM